MTEATLKKTDRRSWFYARAVLVLTAGIPITIVLNRWEWSSWLLLGLLPLITVFAVMNRPAKRLQWIIRILIALLYLLALLPALTFARAHVRLHWNLPTGIVGIIGGSILFAISINKRWANWCSDKPFFVPALLLFISFWATMNGLLYMLSRLIGQ